MAAPYEVAAVALKTIIDTEFTPEGFSARHDRLHESLGWNETAIGISPIAQFPVPRGAAAMETQVRIQFYSKYFRDIDPEQAVDPNIIARFADRFMRAVERADVTIPGTPEVWFFRVTRIDYPLDPTGNNSRFEATVVATGNNVALVETLS